MELHPPDLHNLAAVTASADSSRPAVSEARRASCPRRFTRTQTDDGRYLVEGTAAVGSMFTTERPQGDSKRYGHRDLTAKLPDLSRISGSR